MGGLGGAGHRAKTVNPHSRRLSTLGRSRSPHAGPGENPENKLFRLAAPDDMTLPRPVTVRLDAPFSAAERIILRRIQEFEKCEH